MEDLSWRGRLVAGPRWLRWVIGTGAVVAAAVLPLYRQQGTPSWQTVWAEDGPTYAQQAIRDGGVHVLFRGYAGYLQLVPRLLFVPFGWWSIRHLALYCAVAGVVIAAFLAWFVYRMTAGWIASPLVRLTLASFIVLTPVMGTDNTADIVNIIWAFLAAALFGLVSLEEDRGDTILRAVVVFLAASSSVLCALYLPLALAWLLVRRTVSAMVVGSALCAGLALQAVVMLDTKGEARPPSSIRLIRDGLSVKVFAALLVGPKWALQLWSYNWRMVVVAAPAIVLLLLVVLGRGVRRRNQALSAVLVLYAIVLFAFPVWDRGTGPMNLREGLMLFDFETRFDVVPVILLGAAFALLIAPKDSSPRGWVTFVALPLFVAQVTLLTVVNFSLGNLRSFDTAWRPKVAAIYAKECVGASPDKLVTIPNIPNVFGTPGRAATIFPVTVPCRSLAR